jgi:hypothetical protein
MGVAVAQQPDGPFVKQNDGRPVQDSGHEVQIFRCGGGVMSLVSPTGPKGRTLQYAPDGLHFEAIAQVVTPPAAPGLFRPELTDPEAEAQAPYWGVSMHNGPGTIGLRRFVLTMTGVQIPGAGE